MRLLLAFIFTSILFGAAPSGSWTDSVPSNIQVENPIFSFGLIADVQYCDCEPKGSRFYRSSLVKLREAVNSLKNDSAEFIISLGDLIDKDFTSFKPVMDILDSSGLKTWHCAGNHDFSVHPHLKKQIPFIGSADKYYSIAYSGYRFIFLDGNDISTYSSTDAKKIREAEKLIKSLKEEGEKNAVGWNGGISSRQLKWMTKQLNKAEKNNEKVIISCHFPVYPENVHNLLNHKEVLGILENYSNIIAWFNGHNHAGNYGNLNGIHFITMKGMVETEKRNSFSLVEVYPDKIVINGFGREESRILDY